MRFCFELNCRCHLMSFVQWSKIVICAILSSIYLKMAITRSNSIVRYVSHLWSCFSALDFMYLCIRSLMVATSFSLIYAAIPTILDTQEGLKAVGKCTLLLKWPKVPRHWIETEDFVFVADPENAVLIKVCKYQYEFQRTLQKLWILCVRSKLSRS